MASNQGLYHPSFERDACGIGFVANIKGHKSHQHISDALTVLENMEHRGACGCESNTGDGAGIMIQTPHEFFFDECIKLGVPLPPFGRYGVGVIFFPAKYVYAKNAAIYLTAQPKSWASRSSLIAKCLLIPMVSDLLPLA